MLNSVDFYRRKQYWEQFCRECYEAGANPLPILRKLYPNLRFGWSCNSHTEAEFYINSVIWHAPDEKFVVWGNI